ERIVAVLFALFADDASKTQAQCARQRIRALLERRCEHVDVVGTDWVFVVCDVRWGHGCVAILRTRRPVARSQYRYRAQHAEPDLRRHQRSGEQENEGHAPAANELAAPPHPTGEAQGKAVAMSCWCPHGTRCRAGIVARKSTTLSASVGIPVR